MAESTEATDRLVPLLPIVNDNVSHRHSRSFCPCCFGPGSIFHPTTTPIYLTADYAKIYTAVQTGNHAEVQRLLGCHDIDYFRKCRYGVTSTCLGASTMSYFPLLYFAVVQSQPAIFRELVEFGLPLHETKEDLLKNQPSLRKSLLQLAIERNQVEICHMILTKLSTTGELETRFVEDKSDFIRMEYKGLYGALFLAVGLGYTQICSILLNHRFLTHDDFKQSGISPFLAAVRCKNFNICRMFLDHGANPNEVFDQPSAAFHGQTLLIAAVLADALDIVRLLLSFNAWVDMVDSVNGNTALHYAISKRHVTIVQSLVQEWKAKDSIENRDGFTARDFAAKSTNAYIRALFMVQDNVSIRSNSSSTTEQADEIYNAIVDLRRDVREALATTTPVPGIEVIQKDQAKVMRTEAIANGTLVLDESEFGRLLRKFKEASRTKTILTTLAALCLVGTVVFVTAAFNDNN